MENLLKLTFIILLALSMQSGNAQQTDSDDEMLKIAALEALMSAPSEKALPIVSKVLAGDHSDAVKSRALFVLSQIENDEARKLLLQTANSSNGYLRLEAIRMIGINGDPAATAGLQEIYQNGDLEVKESVLQAYMIAGDNESVFAIASDPNITDDEFDAAVHMLAVMGATEEIGNLPPRPGSSESLIHALAIAGDTERLTVLALDPSDPERQLQAIQGLGISGGDDNGDTLLQIYRDTDNPEVRDAAMRGLMISGDDESVLELFRASQDSEEKRELLRTLVMMDSDAAMQAIDNALDGQE